MNNIMELTEKQKNVYDNCFCAFVNDICQTMHTERESWKENPKPDAEEFYKSNFGEETGHWGSAEDIKPCWDDALRYGQGLADIYRKVKFNYAWFQLSGNEKRLDFTKSIVLPECTVNGIKADDYGGITFYGYIKGSESEGEYDLDIDDFKSLMEICDLLPEKRYIIRKEVSLA